MKWPWRKPEPPTPAPNDPLREFVPDDGACFVMRVAADGSVSGKWSGMTNEQAAEALYSVADAVVHKIPLRKHNIH